MRTKKRNKKKKVIRKAIEYFEEAVVFGFEFIFILIRFFLSL